MSSEYKDEIRTMNRRAFFSLLIIIALWLVFWIFITNSGWLNEWNDRGTFGDMFGAINSLFSGLALAGVIYTILLQRIELKQNTTELRGQKEQFIIQNETLFQQKFENTFFQMLNLHHEIVQGSKLTDGVEGRKFFNRIQKDVSLRFQERLSQTPNYTVDVLSKYYFEIYINYQNVLGHYFRNMYHIVKLVDRSSVSDKKYYTDILRAQLSSSEIYLLFYNCLSENGNQKFKPLIEKYSFLKNLDSSFLNQNKDLTFYEREAFENDDLLIEFYNKYKSED